MTSKEKPKKKVISDGKSESDIVASVKDNSLNSNIINKNNNEKSSDKQKDIKYDLENPIHASDEDKEIILSVFREIYDPEIPINIYDLGLIYDVRVEKKNISVKMTFTTPFCPVIGMILAQVKDKLSEFFLDVDVELVWDPAWNPEMMKKSMDELF